MPTAGVEEKSRHDKPEKGSRSRAFREWIQTTTGLAAVVVSILALGGTGAVIAIKHGNSDGRPIAPTPVPSGLSTSPPHSLGETGSPSATQLERALLPAETLGSSAVVTLKDTDLSQILEICGAPVVGAISTAYEEIGDRQTGQFLVEILTTWDSATDASQSITKARQAVDQSGSCSFTMAGVTQQFTGDYAGSPPSGCTNPGQYLASRASASSPSSASLYQGFNVAAQCGLTTVSLRVESDLPGIDQSTADGYLSNAIGRLDSTIG
jgi:hypothetical protein